MDSYDSRRITLDPGLTVLALRSLHTRQGGYPFVERHTRGRAISAAIRERFAAWFPTLHTLWATHRSLG